MSNYSGYIPKDLANELLELGMPLLADVGSYYKYPIDYDTKDVPSIAHEIRIPTYGEVIDWFSSKGIHITFDTFFTFSLLENVAYLWKISFIDGSNGDMKLKVISEEDAWDGKEGYGGSFEVDARSAIKYAMNNLHFN